MLSLNFGLRPSGIPSRAGAGRSPSGDYDLQFWTSIAFTPNVLYPHAGIASVTGSVAAEFTKATCIDCV